MGHRFGIWATPRKTSEILREETVEIIAGHLKKLTGDPSSVNLFEEVLMQGRST